MSVFGENRWVFLTPRVDADWLHIYCGIFYDIVGKTWYRSRRGVKKTTRIQTTAVEASKVIKIYFVKACKLEPVETGIVA